MKNNQPVTGVEQRLDSAKVLITATDLKGVITYANHEFVRTSGFSEGEVLGSSHNIVRHPDVPPELFADLWRQLAAGRQWLGIIKNRCKNGDHYWVEAYVCPLYNDNQQVIGYQSVRTPADQDDIRRAEAQYQKLRRKSTRIFRYADASLFSKIFLFMLIVAMPPLVILAWYADAGFGVSAAAMLCSTALSYLAARFVSRPLARLSKQTREIMDNSLSNAVFGGEYDDVVQLQVVIKILKARIRTALGRVAEASSELAEAASRMTQITGQASIVMNQHRAHAEQAAAAMNQMSSSVQEVAKNTTETAQAAIIAETTAQTGKVIVMETVNTIDRLAEEIERLASMISTVETRSGAIGKVLDVIRGIAEQTNLLALNAAIEAARAGEQGRGFAVVADEVRSLARRTQESTAEIKQIIESLQQDTSKAAQMMQVSRGKAKESVEHVADAGSSLENILEMITMIRSMTDQIATAAEEQTAVAESINKTIHAVYEDSEETTEGAEQTRHASDKVQALAARLQRLVYHFKT